LVNAKEFLLWIRFFFSTFEQRALRCGKVFFFRREGDKPIII
jgi:hypothetical protein